MKTRFNKRQTRKHRAHWVKNQRTCSCGSRKFDISVSQSRARLHMRNSHRKCFVAVSESAHKTRIGFPSNPRKKK